MTITAPAPRITRLTVGAIGVTVLAAAAFVALLVGLAVGGGADAPLLTDPGEWVRYGLPTAKLLANLGAAGALGALLLALVALSPGRADGSMGNGQGPAFKGNHCPGRNRALFRQGRQCRAQPARTFVQKFVTMAAGGASRQGQGNLAVKPGYPQRDAPRLR